MHEALFFTKLENNTVRCELCPWNCVLKPGQTGSCRVRENNSGTQITHVYNKVSAIAIDPIEKKPLYHFHPGKKILSIGSVGCNLHCSFCQNHHISQCAASDFSGFYKYTPTQIVSKAIKSANNDNYENYANHENLNNIGIAYTYNEPFTFYEFMLETAQLALANGLKNVVVSNGYINPEPLKKLLPFIDAFNIDLKAFTNDFYQKHTKGKLEPVLETLKLISKSKAHLEITTLVIPGLNDDEKEFESMVKWIASELGNQVPLHLSRYHPQYKMQLPATPLMQLQRLHEIAKYHLRFVYLGNVNDAEYTSTKCFHCGSQLIIRNRYQVIISGISSEAKCLKCQTQQNIIF